MNLRPYIAQIRSNLRLMGRDRSVLFFSYLFPLSFFFLFAQSFHATESTGAMTQVITMVLIIGVLGNGFFGAGMGAIWAQTWLPGTLPAVGSTTFVPVGRIHGRW